MGVRFRVLKNMKKCIFIIALALFMCRFGFSAALDNPAGIATVPQSNIRSGLIRRPNPIDRSGNLIITGNVGGGKHFRGVVPYSATSDFTGPLGSSTLDSFLRQSASSHDLDVYTDTSRPYFSRSRTVTTTMAGQSRVISSPNAGFETSGIQRGTSESLFSANTLASQRLSDVQDLTVGSGLKIKPVSVHERSTLANLDLYSQGDNLADTLQLTRVQGITKSLAKVESQRSLRDESLLTEISERTMREESPGQEEQLVDLRISNQQLAEDLTNRIAKIREIADVTVSRESKDASNYDALLELESAEIRRENISELGDISKTLESDSIDSGASALKGDEQTLSETAIGEVSKRNLSDYGGRVDLPTDNMNLDVYRRVRQQDGVVEKGLGNNTGIYVEVDRTSAIESATRDYKGYPKTFSGYQERFAEFSKDRIRQQLKNAEEHLKRGEYYLAADKYTLASVYTTDNPLVWAGKGHALFASGEYISSVLFLSRALAILSEGSTSDSTTLFTFLGENLMLIDRDVIDSRTVDIKQWIKESDAGELHFLAGYVYYQLGRFDEAELSTDKALERIPESTATLLLKKAIKSSQSKAVGKDG
jgi:tetratricopeptide (TPR) repeat protein